jgi:hypothetical protein
MGDEFKWIYDSDGSAPRRLSSAEKLVLNAKRDRAKRGLQMRESWNEAQFLAEELRIRGEIIAFIDARDLAAAQTETETEARAA